METLSSYKQFAKNIMFEADESDKYTHIGYGKYKEKGKEDDKDAQTFKKDDSGKFSPIGGEKGGEEVPDSQKLSGAGEFERPKDTKQDAHSDIYAQDTWDRQGDEEPKDEIDVDIKNIESSASDIDHIDDTFAMRKVIINFVKKHEDKLTDKQKYLINSSADEIKNAAMSIKYDGVGIDEDPKEKMKKVVDGAMNKIRQTIKPEKDVEEESKYKFAEMFKKIGRR